MVSLSVVMMAEQMRVVDLVRKRRVYERAGVAEYWLVHPLDRMVTVYRLVAGEYGKPEGFDLSGEAPVGVLPEVVIQWDGLVERLAPVEFRGRPQSAI